MGQPVAVVEKPSTTPGVVRFQLNRSLTGSGHEHFRTPDDAIGPRPAAVLARRLFDTQQVESVHMFSNIVTVDLREGSDGGGLAGVMRDLYKYWLPGVEPPVFEDEAPAEETSGGSSDGTTGGGEAELSEAAKRVPPHLLDRSRAARERWKAKQAG